MKTREERRSGLLVLPCHLDIREKIQVDHVYRINLPKRPGLVELTGRTGWSYLEGEQEPGGTHLSSTDTEAGPVCVSASLPFIL